VEKVYNPRYYFDQIHEIRWWALLAGAFCLMVFMYLDTIRFSGDSLKNTFTARLTFQLLPFITMLVITVLQKRRKISRNCVFLVLATCITLIGIGHGEIIKIAHHHGYIFPRIGLTIVLIYAGILLVMPVVYSAISSLCIIGISSYAYYLTGLSAEENFSISISYTLFAGCCVFMNHVCTRILLAYAKLVKRINDQANTDNLTKLSNRRHFFELAEQVYKQCHRQSSAFAVMLVDLDHFKQVNDTLGHKTGDHVLIKVADILRSLCRRPLDLAARFGGDEFVMLLHDSNEDHIKKTCEQIISSIEAINDSLKSKAPGIEFGVSVGVAFNNGSEPFTIKNLIDMADQSLYEVKRNGKNDYSLAHNQNFLKTGHISDFLNLA